MPRGRYNGRMKVRDIVETAIRLVGVVFLYNALNAVPAAIANFCPIFPHLNFRTLFPSAILVGWPLLIGYYMVRGAPWLMRRAFDQRPATSTPVRPKMDADLFGGGPARSS
jgi:hypothetical protein